MHIVAGKSLATFAKKSRSYDDTRGDRCNRQGMRDAAHKPAGISGQSRNSQASVLQVEAPISGRGRAVAGSCRIRPDDAGRSSSSARFAPKVQGKATEAARSRKFPDGGAPHIKRFGDANPGEYDRSAPAGDNICEQCLVWTVA